MSNPLIEQIPIAEDLRELYDGAKQIVQDASYLSLKKVSTTPGEQLAIARKMVELIERTSREEAPVKCSRCETLIPRGEVIRCADCKEPLCEKHLRLHFTEEDLRIRSQRSDYKHEAEYRLSEVTRLQAEVAQLKAELERRSAPVSDEEMAAHAIHYMKLGPLHGPAVDTPVLTKSQADALLTARTQGGSNGK